MTEKKKKQIQAISEVAIEQANKLKETVMITMFGLEATAIFDQDSLRVKTVNVESVTD